MMEGDSFFDRPRSVEETAAYVGVTVKFVRDEICRGHLRACRISRRCIRILPSDLQRWL